MIKKFINIKFTLRNSSNAKDSNITYATWMGGDQLVPIGQNSNKIVK